MSSRIRRNAILGAVAAHFILSSIAQAPTHSYLFKVPVVSQLVRLYQRFGVVQRWSMFQAPIDRDYSIHYEVRTAAGWGPRQRPAEPFVRQVRERVIQPRSAARMFTYWRVIPDDLLPMGPTSGRAFYYQQLADYLCRGSGKVPGALEVRFIVNVHRLPPFHAPDAGVLTASENRPEDGDHLVYEQDCD